MGPETGSPGETFAIPFNDGSRSSCDAMVLTASYQDDFEQFYRGDIGQVETVYGGSSEGGQDTGPSEPPAPWKKKKKQDQQNPQTPKKRKKNTKQKRGINQITKTTAITGQETNTTTTTESTGTGRMTTTTTTTITGGIVTVHAVFSNKPKIGGL